MANEAISVLERNLRERAVIEATNAFAKAKQALLNPGWPISTNSSAGADAKVWTSEDSNQLNALLEKFLKIQIIPKAEEKAIREFMNSYARLVVELPALQEAAYQEGQNDALQD